MNLFEAIKNSVTTRQAAEHYGIKVNRTGKACCIFHDDRHPSMKVDERFHCFSCGADGDVIDFAAQIFGTGLKEAAERLAVDFNISFDQALEPPEENLASVRRSLIKRLKTYQNENYRVLCSYFRLLREWQTEYAPKRSDEDLNPLFLEAIQNCARVEYLLDELQGCSPESAKKIITLNKNEIGRYANRVREVHANERGVSQEASR